HPGSQLCPSTTLFRSPAAVANLSGVEAERRHAGDQRPDAAATDPIDVEAGIGEGRDRADVREPAGAASRQDDSEGTAGEPACDPDRTSTRLNSSHQIS